MRPATGCASCARSCAIRDASAPDLPGDGVLTTDFASIRDDPSIALVAELMGGVEPTGDYVLELLRAGKPVVSANKQLVARRGAELFAAASKSGVQLRFEASVCAAIPVIKVLRESFVATNVHRVLGIVNGTTNFILSQMEHGAEYPDALAEAQRLGFAEPDPTEDVNGADAAAKMAILATVAFGSRTTLDDVAFEGIEAITQEHVRAARELEMTVRLVGSATLVDGRLDVRVQPSLVDRHHPLAAVEGPFNAVMLQGDAIREITLEGPGAGGLETASAVVADMILDRRHDRHRLPAERRLLARARAASAGRPALAVLLPRRGRRRARRARAHCACALAARRVDRAPRRRISAKAARRSHAVTHETRARLDRGRTRGDRVAARDAVAADGAAGDLLARRHRDGLDVIPLVERYRSRLPLGAGDPVVTLYEGSTPLVHARRAVERARRRPLAEAREHEPDRLVQGSRHDRGGLPRGRRRRDGRRVRVDREHGRVGGGVRGARRVDRRDPPAGGRGRAGKLAQARAVGARLVAVRGTFDETLRAARALGDSGRYVLVNSLNPFRIEGQKTAAFEIAEELGRVPDVLALPYGGGGNTRAYARGFTEWDAGMPRIVAGAAARRDDTLASAIRIAQPAHRAEAEAAIRDSGGAVVELTDDEIVAAWRRLAELEGIFCEPASAAGVAATREGGSDRARSSRVITGHGLKDPDAVERIGSEIVEIDADAVVGDRSCFVALSHSRAGSRAGDHGEHRAGLRLRGRRVRPLDELTVSEGGEPDREHLGVRAFALLADPGGLRFDFTDRIPRARGLGSSASIIALGLAAASLVNGDDLDPERLLALGLPLEGHADNLSAALAGGVCLTWEGRIARIAETLPLAPIAVVPESRVLDGRGTRVAPRAGHASCGCGHRRSCGAARRRSRPQATPSSSQQLERRAARAVPRSDRARVRRRARRPADGAAGATISGSGPTVIVWAEEERADECARELEARFADATVLRLRVSAEGVGRA